MSSGRDGARRTNILLHKGLQRPMEHALRSRGQATHFSQQVQEGSIYDHKGGSDNVFGVTRRSS